MSLRGDHFMLPASFFTRWSSESLLKVIKERMEFISSLPLSDQTMGTRLNRFRARELNFDHVCHSSTILVNRGWVPAQLIKTWARREAQVTGAVTILGNLVPGEESPGIKFGDHQFLTMQHQVDKNIWYWKDVKAMAAVVGADPILIDVQADPPNPGGYPVGGVTEFPLNNPYPQRAAIAYALYPHVD